MPILHLVNIYFLVTIIKVACRKCQPSYHHAILNINTSNKSKWNIFLDYGTNICLPEQQYITQLNLDVTKLITEVSTVGGSKLTCTGWLPTTYQIGNKTTWQSLYINKLDKIYFSKKGLSTAAYFIQTFQHQPAPPYHLETQVLQQLNPNWHQRLILLLYQNSQKIFLILLYTTVFQNLNHI